MLEIILMIIIITILAVIIIMATTLLKYFILFIFGKQLMEVLEIGYWIILLSLMILSEKALLPFNYPGSNIPVSCFIIFIGIFFIIGCLIILAAMLFLFGIFIYYCIDSKFRMRLKLYYLEYKMNKVLKGTGYYATPKYG